MSLADKLLIWAALTFTASGCCEKPEQRTYPAVGDVLPQFAVTMSDGRAVSSGDLSDGAALIVFFHTACPDCQKELDILQPYWNEHHDEMQIVLVSRAESAASVSAYWTGHGYTMPYSAQNDRAVYDLFSERGIPYVVQSMDGVITGIWDDRNVFTGE